MPTPTEQQRIDELHRQAADDYANAQTARDWQTNRDDANLNTTTNR